MLFKRGLRLFKGLCLLFLPNVPGATFIQGGMLIPDSRVVFILFRRSNFQQMLNFEFSKSILYVKSHLYLSENNVLFVSLL